MLYTREKQANKSLLISTWFIILVIRSNYRDVILVSTPLHTEVREAVNRRAWGRKSRTATYSHLSITSEYTPYSIHFLPPSSFSVRSFFAFAVVHCHCNTCVSGTKNDQIKLNSVPYHRVRYGNFSQLVSLSHISYSIPRQLQCIIHDTAYGTEQSTIYNFVTRFCGDAE